ncbi:MAG: isoamylase early set domain-containing protein [Acidimicrobiales bacterium]
MMRIDREGGQDGMVTVTFVQPDVGPDGSTSVLGDFNGWHGGITVMHSSGGVRSASVVVRAGYRYAFRYLDEVAGWFNDEAADAYEANGFGGDNGVIDLTGGGAADPAPPQTKRRRMATAGARQRRASTGEQ